MKSILYVYLADIESSSGITNKVNGICEAFEKNSFSWMLFTLSSKAEKIGLVSKNKYVLPSSYFEKKTELYSELDKFIKSQTVFDIYFLRYPFASKELFYFMEKNPFKVIIEHNTKEISEIRFSNSNSWIKKFKIRPTPSYVKLLIDVYWKPLFTEYYYGKKILGLAKMGVAVTQEIAKYEMSRNKSYKCVLLSNGVDVKRVPFYKRVLKEGEVVNIIMLVSSSSNWHGVDLIVKSFNKYKNNTIHLYLIGKISEKDQQEISLNRNITSTGFLTSSEFDIYLKSAHLGLGSFGIFRKKLKEATTLKVREYLASGLPVFLGHIDSDIEQSEELKKYARCMDIEKADIDWNTVYKWAVTLYKEEDINEKIRNIAFEQLDFGHYVNVLKSL
ncbi:MAG: hypothetical protein ABI199_08740 [Bacteroidia bacterium]